MLATYPVERFRRWESQVRHAPLGGAGEYRHDPQLCRLKCGWRTISVGHHSASGFPSRTRHAFSGLPSFTLNIDKR